MNVSNNVITYTSHIKLDTLKQSGGNEEFKKALDDNTLQSQDSTNQEDYKTTSKDETSDKTETQNTDNVTAKDASDSVKAVTVEDVSVNNSNATDATNNISMKITDVIKKIIALLKQNMKGTSNEQGLLDNTKGSTEIINNIKTIIDSLKQNVNQPSKKLIGSDTSTDVMAQIQQLLQSLSSMLQSINKATVTKTSGTEISSIDLKQQLSGEQLAGNMLQNINKATVPKTPATDTKNIVKSNISEIVSLLEKSKGNSDVSTQILEDLQKLTQQVKELQGNSSVVKVSGTQIGSENIEEKPKKDNLIKMVMKQSTETTSETSSKNSMQSSSDSKKDNTSSGNSSTDDKFLKNLLSGDKEDTKISKAVSFMNQFETVKTIETTKVQNTDLVINKNNVAEDVIKSVKFMELNNIKDLTVKMNPKELGEITIKLTMESGNMKASLSAQNKDTYNLLNRNIQNISDGLKNMDIKIQSLDISLYEDSTFFSKDSSAGNNNSQQNNNSKTNNDSQDDDISISDNYAIEDNQINKFA